MTMFRHDDLLAGIPAGSTVALLCAETISVNAAARTMKERLGFSQPMCFRSFRQPSAPPVGVRPGRKQGPEENSHKYLSLSVCADRNVA
ncbi:hypothetical protein H7I87_01080 [Mycobacterium timonense]|uniref:HTH araC/xylS-type domain-containing protein n=1 Tax=Mycobacterium bouchedurhonense TaxID=701041 RepID=A0AAW5SE01_MYCBC|nr:MULTISPECIES: hypothetical protein [Mycobacterium avium complex (MAC)]MCV6992844.1 hypothetical protein [Mycobacterium bouchedurhonense]MCV6993327.1 hypothetical protein [Mycobacterium timonense]